MNKMNVKRSGIYGKGFEDLPFEEQKKRIDKAFKFEPPGRVVQQMDFLVATSDGNPKIERIKNYALKKSHELEGKPDMITYKTKIKNCPSGYVMVRSHTNNGKRIQSYCRRKGQYARPELRKYISR